jgi:hypothetical protein
MQSWELRVPLHILLQAGMFLDFLSVAIFIKGHIPADLNVMVTWYVDSEGLGDLTVSHKYSLTEGSNLFLISLGI